MHGANLGIRASAYRAAGGFQPLPTAEDHALIAAATAAGCRVLRAADVTVETSARRQARAPRGFSHVLRALSRPPPAGARPRRRPPAVCLPTRATAGSMAARHCDC